MIRNKYKTDSILSAWRKREGINKSSTKTNDLTESGKTDPDMMWEADKLSTETPKKKGKLQETLNTLKELRESQPHLAEHIDICYLQVNQIMKLLRE